MSSTEAPTITTQPAPQSTPLTQSATFTVVASGTAPLSYHWSRNGTPISGATQASYVTPPVQPSDSGANFSVTVSNGAGSVDSNAAALTVGPRSPKPGDLRFQQVDAPSTSYGPTIGGLSINLLPGQRMQYTNWIGMPFKLPGICNVGELGGCTWFCTSLNLPADVSGLGVTYQSDPMEKFAADLVTYSASNMVINSLDEEPGNDTFALESTNTTQTTGFAMTHSVADVSDLQVLATQLGLQSKVITAVSFNAAGQLDVLSFSWQSDPATPYDALVAPVTLDTVAAKAQQMAAEGYIITAFGGNVTSGFVLVGTRVQGDSIPRPLIGSSSMSTAGKGFAAVAMPTDWNTNPYTPIWIFEQ
ncbi:MAG TPA: immunoglobulin domain-containing protein [Acidobacteriaceae bacterium]|nr:immunoglobulin domain-containing protein [Acidobacteriaceae bacterium]